MIKQTTHPALYATAKGGQRLKRYFTEDERLAFVEPIAEILAPQHGAASAPTVIGPRNAPGS